LNDAISFNLCYQLCVYPIPILLALAVAAFVV